MICENNYFIKHNRDLIVSNAKMLENSDVTNFFNGKK
jgi:hypothetical protein